MVDRRAKGQLVESPVTPLTGGRAQPAPRVPPPAVASDQKRAGPAERPPTYSIENTLSCEPREPLWLTALPKNSFSNAPSSFHGKTGSSTGSTYAERRRRRCSSLLHTPALEACRT